MAIYNREDFKTALPQLEKELNRKIEELEKEIEDLKKRIEELENA